MYTILELYDRKEDGFKPMNSHHAAFDDLDRAEGVLKELAAKYPGNEFVLLKAIKSVKVMPVFSTETKEF